MRLTTVTRIFAVWLSISLAMPPFAWGLRAQAGLENQTQADLGQRFQPSAGLEQTHQAAEILRSIGWQPSSGVGLVQVTENPDVELVSSFVASMNHSLGPRLEPELLSRLSGGQPYVVGQWSLAEAEGTAQETGLLSFTMANIQRVLRHAGAQLGFDTQQALTLLGEETVRSLAKNLFQARDASGVRLLGGETSVSTLIRLFYRELLVEVVPRVVSGDAPIDQEQLLRALRNPFREVNQRRNEAMIRLVKTLLRSGELLGETLTDDPKQLQANPQFLTGWLHLLVAANVTGQMNPNWQVEAALMQAVYEIASVPFAWSEQADRDLSRYRAILAASPSDGFVTEADLPDNNGQAVVSLKAAEARLSTFPDLKIDFIPKGADGFLDDVSVNDVEQLLADHPEFFRHLIRYREEGRFVVLPGPRSHGFPLDLLPQETALALLDAEAVLVEGSANVRMINGIAHPELYLLLSLKYPLTKRMFGVDPQGVGDYNPVFLHADGSQGPLYSNLLDRPDRGPRVTVSQRLGLPASDSEEQSGGIGALPEVIQRLPLSLRLYRLLADLAVSQPQVVERFAALQEHARERWRAILEQQEDPLNIAVVVPSFAGETDRIGLQDSIKIKLEEMQALLDEDEQKVVTMTLYIVDDKPGEGLKQVVEDHYDRAQVDVERIHIQYLRLEDAILEGHPAIRDLGLTSSEESFKWGAVKLGMSVAVEEGADVVVMTDADSNQRMTELPNLVAPVLLEGTSAVVGSRFVKGAATNTLAVHNYIELFLYNPLVDAAMPEMGHLWDVQSGFKAFSAQVLRDVLPETRTYQVTGDSEILWLIARSGGTILETPRSELEESKELSTIDPTRYLEFIRQLEQQLTQHGKPKGIPPAGLSLVQAITHLSPEIWSQADQAVLAKAIDDMQTGNRHFTQVLSSVMDLIPPRGDETSGEGDSAAGLEGDMVVFEEPVLLTEQVLPQIRSQIQDLAEAWEIYELPALHVVGVTQAGLEADPSLAFLREGHLRVGDVLLAFVPEEKGGMEQLLVSLMSEPRAVHFHGYGADEDSTLKRFFTLVRRIPRFFVSELSTVGKQFFEVQFKQLVANLSGIVPTAKQLVTLKQLLARLRAA